MAITLSLPPGTGHPATQHSINSRLLCSLLTALFFALTPAQAELSPTQRRVDFEQLMAAVAKSYAPYQWKKDALGIEALDARPWLERIPTLKDDFEYYELCMEYVASLQDLHSGYFLRTDFTAELPFLVDLYDGVPLVEYIYRAYLPEFRYPFQVGDELISVDGQPVFEWIYYTALLQSFGRPETTMRWALDQITFRAQATIPRASLLGTIATVQVRRASTGVLETYTMPWLKFGTPLIKSGTIPTPQYDTPTDETAPRLTIRRAPGFKRLSNFGAVPPVFDLPANFAPRRGTVAGDPIYSGIYESDGHKLGFLRIPEFPSTTSGRLSMLRALDTDLPFLQANTEGLILDVMRNPGGAVCLTNEILARLIPQQFRTVGDQFRPTLDTVEFFRQNYTDALSSGADSVTVSVLKSFLRDVQTAYTEPRGITGPLPVCGLSLDLQPAPALYTKPIVLVVDEFSASSADAFAVVLQDSGRALVFGKETAGGGGLSFSTTTGFYSEGIVSLSETLGTREKTIEPPTVPPTNYIEIVGAIPDFPMDYMTRENLMSGGKAYVDAFTEVLVELIRNVGPPEDRARALPSPK